MIVLLLQWVTALLLLLGAVLCLLAAVGVLRFPDTFLRMQASAKASTLGLACLLAGTALQFPEVSMIMRLGSIAAFIMLTAPLSAHVIARVSLHRGTPLWEGTVLNEYEPTQCAPEDEPTSSSVHTARPASPNTTASASGALEPSQTS
ncbi:MAG: monovalent cation/H(+) antiporter subunit G [Pseudomonadota bacterium]